MRGDKIRGVIDRAIGRGKLPANVDRGCVADLLIGPLYWRLVVLGHNASRVQLRALARMTAAALKAG